MKKAPELVKGNTDYLLLFLIGQKPMYGYQIIKELEERTRGYFKYKEGTLYPALHRLEKTGLLQARWQEAIGNRQRRYYHITDKGCSVLEERRSQWLSFLTAMNAIVQPATG